MCDQRVVSTARGICMSLGELMVGAGRGASLTRGSSCMIFCLSVGWAVSPYEKPC